MDAKELIQLNNEKREQLNKSNKEYYEKMLVYMRTHLTVSEQQTEELLMELLDHLLDAQAQGKRAEEVFGENPAAYCDEMIKQLPKEKARSTALFVGYLVLYLVGWLALMSGLALVAIQWFVQDVNRTVYVGTAAISFLIIAISILVAVLLVFNLMKQTVYTKLHKIKLFASFFFVFAFCNAVVFLVPRIIPSFGAAVEIDWYVYIVPGVIIVALARWMNRKYRITK